LVGREPVGGEIPIKPQLGSGTNRGNDAATRDGQEKQEEVPMCRCAVRV